MKVEAIGPGGAVLATAGTDADPLRATMPGSPPDDGSAGSGSGSGSGGMLGDDYFNLRKVPVWAWIVGASVIVAATATFLLVYFKRSDETDLGRPHIRDPEGVF